MNLTPQDFQVLTPYILLTVWACVLLLVDLFIPKDRKGITACYPRWDWPSRLGFTLSQIGIEGTGFFGMVVLDGFSTFVNALILRQRPARCCPRLRLRQTHGHRTRRILHTPAVQHHRHDAHGASRRPHHRLHRARTALHSALRARCVCVSKPESEEAGLKYFLLGAFATGFVVYGTALVYGATGSTNLFAIVQSASNGTSSLLLTLGAALSSSDSASRSPPSPSTCGPRTCTRARPPQ
jgi:NADH-quinone oxidoreductase subunit N